MLKEGDRVIVAVSGGVDSVVLLHILKRLEEEYRLRLVVAHLNHSIRKKEAEMDARFVERLASSNHLPFKLSVIDVPELISKEGLSPQEAARKARYKFFEDLSKRYKADRVALGHNRDDQAETILMRFIRGSGTRGLKGMKPVRKGFYIRPLIDVTRKEIEKYADMKGIKYVTDSTNVKDIYFRNRVRSELIPFLEKRYNPNIKEELLRFSKLMERDDEFLEGQVERYIKDLVKATNGDGLSLDIDLFLSIHGALRVRIIRRIWKKLTGHSSGIYNCHIEGIMELLESDSPNSNMDLPSGIRFVREYDRVSFTKRKLKPIPSFQHRLIIPGLTVIPEVAITIKSKVIDDPDSSGRIDLKADENRVFFDYDRLKLPLYLRGFQPGDRFRPFGMRGRKKVKDLFIDLKIPRFKRMKVPLLLSQDDIVWVVGVRRSAEARVVNTTHKILKVEVVKPS